MPRFDLHAHSTHSDGLLTPAGLVQRAAVRGVDVLALTDHDELSGLAEAKAQAAISGLRLIGGVEVSVSWREITLHVLALGIDPGCPTLCEGLAAIRTGRLERARRIGDSLAEAGIPGAYEGALQFVTSERLISRTHFARFLVQAGHVREMRDVFKRYLVRGKPGHVEHTWATLPEAIDWIHAAGGRSVLAHPGRYKATPTAMRELLAEFRDAGGAGTAGGPSRRRCLGADRPRRTVGTLRSGGCRGRLAATAHCWRRSVRELAGHHAACPGLADRSRLSGTA